MNQDQVLTLQLTLAETNQVLLALGEQPFNKVFPLIGKIKEQADPQVRSVPPAPVEAANGSAAA